MIKLDTQQKYFLSVCLVIGSGIALFSISIIYLNNFGNRDDTTTAPTPPTPSLPREDTVSENGTAPTRTIDIFSPDTFTSPTNDFIKSVLPDTEIISTTGAQVTDYIPDATLTSFKKNPIDITTVATDERIYALRPVIEISPFLNRAKAIDIEVIIAWTHTGFVSAERLPKELSDAISKSTADNFSYITDVLEKLKSSRLIHSYVVGDTTTTLIAKQNLPYITMIAFGTNKENTFISHRDALIYQPSQKQAWIPSLEIPLYLFSYKTPSETSLIGTLYIERIDF
ncbi:MAG: hypothetical protein QM526_02135 [Alphaproteobacteria bacterium]|nr:hypothetical protein [Alphaproteobacteria bacterium]